MKGSIVQSQDWVRFWSAVVELLMGWGSKGDITRNSGTFVLGVTSPLEYATVRQNWPRPAAWLRLRRKA